MRDLVERDLVDASIPALSADRRFATAYNAALQTSKMVIACSGYRASGSAHHQITFEAAELALGPSTASLFAYFDACRRKRNTVDYDRAAVASDTEAAQILKEARNLLVTAEEWISNNHSSFKKA
ncbi:MAG: hypothetical protein ACLQVD_05045 [Capsulimonadaceae bacterium]